jgi:2-succinyl-5-enolpyruvyl-6-hydroxy-3-cyclohexene-1-carboxylate synthase
MLQYCGRKSGGFCRFRNSKSIKKPVAITCTSGSAAPIIIRLLWKHFIRMYRFWFWTDRQILLIFLTMTIRQKNIFQQHSYGDFELLEDEKDGSDDYNFETIKKPLNCVSKKAGRFISIFALTEPLYNFVDECL